MAAEVRFIPGGIDPASGVVVLAPVGGECGGECVSSPVGESAAGSVWCVVNMCVYRYA